MKNKIGKNEIDNLLLLNKLIKNSLLERAPLEKINDLFNTVVNAEYFFVAYHPLGKSVYPIESAFVLTKIVSLYGGKIKDAYKVRLINLLISQGARTNSKELMRRHLYIPRIIFSNYDFYRREFDYTWGLVVNGLNCNVNNKFNDLSCQYGIHLNKNFRKNTCGG